MFTPDEAVSFLAGALPDVPVGTDPRAAARLAERCGYLPLALSVLAGHVRNTDGWTLTDHADRLDERRHQQRLDSGVEFALSLSYQHLPADRQRLLRLAALHPGQDFDAYAAAALTGTRLVTARTRLGHLRRDHLLQESGRDRYSFHDLVRTYAAGRAQDQDRPAERRAALTRLFDHYLAVSAAAVNVLDPAERHWRPPVPATDTPAPELTDPHTATVWLDTERSTLTAVAAHTAAHGWPGHTVRLSRTLCSYFNDSGHFSSAVTVHGHARQAALYGGDRAGQAHAMRDLGYAYLRLGDHEMASTHLEPALDLFRELRDPLGEARALTSLGYVADRTGDYPQAIARKRHALTLYRQEGDRLGQTRALLGLGISLRRIGDFADAIDCYQQNLTLARQSGDLRTVASTLNNLGVVETQLERYDDAHTHLQHALTLYRQFASRAGEAHALDNLGLLHNRHDQPEAATACHHQARAHAGLGRAHHALGHTDQARHHCQQAAAFYTDLGTPEADEVRARLAALSTDTRTT
ncbi:tetratricopeptide repeat protein [Paractinoplanes rishiriensis]|uniref:Tetratricopeptide repeat protein n=1 Tax=Paractinoplanes rishiriensis TaxID=1050105 RepID=A0A919MRF9_9ACTN|nr:tetratricopeptide repeat protein [Actinoplanes rishiriensis]GIE97161.1 hypothetical protein Ari01nite_46260 [Actinoplanes rishiriensis]